MSLQKLLELWNRFKNIPGGKFAFSKMLGLAVPYTGSLGAVVEEFERGRVVVRLGDRRGVRNHLKSIHAMALANLGEFSSGLAVNSALSPKQRSILVGFEIKYLKKARGTLHAISKYTLPQADLSLSFDAQVEANIENSKKEVVASVIAHWKIGPIPKEKN